MLPQTGFSVALAHLASGHAVLGLLSSADVGPKTPAPAWAAWARAARHWPQRPVRAGVAQGLTRSRSRRWPSSRADWRSRAHGATRPGPPAAAPVFNCLRTLLSHHRGQRLLLFAPRRIHAVVHRKVLLANAVQRRSGPRCWHGPRQWRYPRRARRRWPAEQPQPLHVRRVSTSRRARTNSRRCASPPGARRFAGTRAPAALGVELLGRHGGRDGNARAGREHVHQPGEASRLTGHAQRHLGHVGRITVWNWLASSR